MNKTEAKVKAEMLGMMFQAFPSARSSMTAEIPGIYLFAVEEFSVEAVQHAVHEIVRGKVEGLNRDFPPSAPRLAEVVKNCEGRLKVERHEANTVFVIENTELWTKMEILRRDKALPTCTRSRPDGTKVRGWSFDKAEMQRASELAIPPPVSASRFKMITDRWTKHQVAGRDLPEVSTHNPNMHDRCETNG